MLKDFLKELSFKDKADFAEFMLGIITEEEKEKILSEMGISEEKLLESIREIRRLDKGNDSSVAEKLYMLPEKFNEYESGSLPQFLSFSELLFDRILEPFYNPVFADTKNIFDLKHYVKTAKRKYGPEVTPSSVVRVILEEKDKNDTCLLSGNYKSVAFYSTIQASIFLSALALYVYHLPDEFFKEALLSEE